MISIWKDLDGDGTADHLTINLIGGRAYADEELWCGGQGLMKVEGTFEICVALAGRTTICTPLNPLLIEPHPYWQYGHDQSFQADLWFRLEPWSLEFADYNHDGRLDFALGQYGNCRGWTYTILTVDAHGVVTRILNDHLWLKGEFGDSTCFALTGTGIRYSAWRDDLDAFECKEYATTPPSQLLTPGVVASGPCPEDTW